MKNDSSEKMTKKAAATGNILETFENIVEACAKSGLPDELFAAEGAYAALAPHLKFASHRLGLTPVQTVLLALFVDRCDDTSIRLPEIAAYCECRNTRILRLSAEVERLEALRYIRASRGSQFVSYRVPLQVLDALSHNEPYVYEADPVTDVRSFFDAFNEIMDDCDNNEITYTQLKARTLGCLADIAGSPFGRQLTGYKLNEDELVLGIYMMHLYVENSDDNIGFHDIDDIYDNGKIPGWIKARLTRRSSELFEVKIIENVNEDGMARNDAFKITESAKTELLGELDLKGKRSANDLERHEKFAAKKLVYNAEERKQVDELAEILMPERFDDVQARLEKAGMRKGFCCLFYGAPGTGKTETVYQLARATRRDILRVDVDKIKSCWVGESEKNIKKLFDRYRMICRDSVLTPILLFNEADAVLGVRMEGASRAVDKMENSIQNIILQEMESLEGIMIATTNLTTNLDKAFERRFLYKIRYNRPSPDMRAKIWKGMMPELPETVADRLGRQFDLSGGQIENVVRRHTVNAILKGREVIDIDAITEVCLHESIVRESRSLGFKVS